MITRRIQKFVLAVSRLGGLRLPSQSLATTWRTQSGPQSRLPERDRGTIISFPSLPEAVGSFSSTAKDAVTSYVRRTLPRSI